MIPTSIVRGLLVAALATVIGCGSKPSKPPLIEDAGVDDGGVELVDLAGRYDRRCVSGDLEACRNLGVMYADGQGVSRDRERSVKLFVQSCSGGHLSACNNLALAYLEGNGVDRQPAKAADTFQRACDGGYKLACRNLGLMLRDGRAVPADLTRAETLLDKACKGAAPFACNATRRSTSACMPRVSRSRAPAYCAAIYPKMQPSPSCTTSTRPGRWAP